MKREDLKKIEGLSDAAIDSIMALHGQDTDAHKKALSALETERDQMKAQIESLNTQLAEAGKQIEAFKGMDIESVKKSAEEYRVAAEKAKADAAAQLAALKFDHSLEGALTSAKAKNAKAVKALLQADALKLQEDGSILGLKEQLEKIKAENDYLFESETAVTDPKIVGHAEGSKKSPLSVFEAAARQAAGLK